MLIRHYDPGLQTLAYRLHRFVLTVGGDLSRAELLRVAESLREHA